MKIWLFAALLISNPLQAQDDADRLRPPGKVECSRDHLTAYTGKVIHYRRSEDRISLRIATDWGTLETVNVLYSRFEDPSDRFLIEGKSFAQSDWQRIESSEGQLRTGVRATAWICDDGRTPVIDWLPPSR